MNRPAFCTSCGTAVVPPNRFCRGCGKSVDTAPDPVQIAPDPVQIAPDPEPPSVATVPAASAKTASGRPRSDDWTATHRVPSGGVTLWPQPDPVSAPNGRLASGVELEVVRVWGAWAEIRLANGWIAWVDNRKLEGSTA